MKNVIMKNVNKKRRNATSMEYLMPKDKFIAEWSKVKELEEEQQCFSLAKIFKVTNLICALRIRQLNLIT